MQVSDNKRRLILWKIDAGWSRRDVAWRFDVPREVVNQIVREARGQTVRRTPEEIARREAERDIPAGRSAEEHAEILKAVFG